MPTTTELSIAPLTLDGFAPYGQALCTPVTAADPARAFEHPGSDFWHQHLFRSGDADGCEILWVDYRNRTLRIEQLEVHLKTEQAIVPLTAGIVHCVARSAADGSPDWASLAAFEVLPGQGLSMAPGVWHATRVVGGTARCLMLTRASTTRDLVAHLRTGAALRESALCTTAPMVLRAPDTDFASHTAAALQRP